MKKDEKKETEQQAIKTSSGFNTLFSMLTEQQKVINAAHNLAQMFKAFIDEGLTVDEACELIRVVLTTNNPEQED